MPYIITYGSLNHGYTFVGPFIDAKEAVDYGTKYLSAVQWDFSELDKPKTHQDDQPDGGNTVSNAIQPHQIFRTDPSAATAVYYLRNAFQKATDDDSLSILDPNAEEAMMRALVLFIDNPVAEVKHWLDTGKLLIQPDPER